MTTYMYSCILIDYDIIMTELSGEYDIYDVTTTWQWNNHEMAMRWPWHHGHVLLVSWSWDGHFMIMSLSVLHYARIVSLSWYGRTLVSGHNIIINGHLWSFMRISLPCLHYLKLVLRSLFKVITGSWLIIPRQSQVRDMVKACPWGLFHDKVMVML